MPPTQELIVAGIQAGIGKIESWLDSAAQKAPVEYQPAFQYLRDQLAAEGAKVTTEAASAIVKAIGEAFAKMDFGEPFEPGQE